MALSKAKRRKIYLEAAEFFLLPSDERVVMGQGILSGFCDYADVVENLGCELFEEYQRFSPDYNSGWYWFDYQEERSTALLLCAEMCNP